MHSFITNVQVMLLVCVPCHEEQMILSTARIYNLRWQQRVWYSEDEFSSWKEQVEVDSLADQTV